MPCLEDRSIFENKILLRFTTQVQLTRVVPPCPGMRPHHLGGLWGTSELKPRRWDQVPKITVTKSYMKRRLKALVADVQKSARPAPSAPSIAPDGRAGIAHELSCSASIDRIQSSIRQAAAPPTRPTSSCFTVTPARRWLPHVWRAAELDHNGLRRGAANDISSNVPTLDHEGLRTRLQGPVGRAWPLAKPVPE